MRPYPQQRRISGFSLIELMVAIAFFSIAVGALFAVFSSVQKSSTSNEVSARVMQSLRTAMGVMESDIRMAGLNRFGTAGAGIEAATATLIRFTADRNMDGTINTADVSDNSVEDQDLERITYAYDAANRRLRQCLSEGATDAWETVADNVDNFNLQYFDENNNLLALPIADTTIIRAVEVSLTIRQTAGRADDVTRTITKQIFCRNLSF